MKKLMVLLFVLALVNVANAGYVDLVISSVGPSDTGTVPIPPVKEITIAPSMWVDIDVLYYADEGWSLFSLQKEMVITGPASASIASITWGPGWNMDLSSITLLPSGNPLISTAATDIGTVHPGIVLDHFLLHCEGIEDVTVALVEYTQDPSKFSSETDGSDLFPLGQDGPGVVIHQPEPMTLTLLGLGSLFLARRKK